MASNDSAELKKWVHAPKDVGHFWFCNSQLRNHSPANLNPLKRPRPVTEQILTKHASKSTSAPL